MRNNSCQAKNCAYRIFIMANKDWRCTSWTNPRFSQSCRDRFGYILETREFHRGIITATIEHLQLLLAGRALQLQIDWGDEIIKQIAFQA